MTSTPPLDDWESVGNEEQLDVKELKSQIYDLQKLTLADARESTLLKDKKDIQSELDDTKKKVSVLEEMKSNQKRELMLLKTDKKNEDLLEEEIEKSGQMKVEIMQLKQRIKEQESLEGMLNAKTKELDLAKKRTNDYRGAVEEALNIAKQCLGSGASPAGNITRLRDIRSTLENVQIRVKFG